MKVQKGYRMPVFVGVMAAILLGLPVLGVTEGVQFVKITPQQITIAPGQTASLSLTYDVTQGAKKTAGVGFRLCFDSRIIEKLALTDIYGEGLVAVDEVAMDDVDNADRDILTDKYLGIAWMGVGNDWPSMAPLPISVGILAIKAGVCVNGSTEKDTVIRIVQTGVPEGYELRAEEVTITVR